MRVLAVRCRRLTVRVRKNCSTPLTPRCIARKYARRRGRMPTPISGVAAVVGARPHAAAEVSVPHRRESRLRSAVVANEFEVHFQPMIDVVGSKIIGAEALLRWRDPERGLVLPASFLPLAEDTGLIVPIGETVSCAWRVRAGDALAAYTGRCWRSCFRESLSRSIARA